MCDGSGVSFASSDGTADGRYTRTCFAGWSYEFELTGTNLPATLTVAASPQTSWQLTVVAR
jgi:hypothetical protein